MKIINADCRDAMQNMMQESFDSIVTDPPYGLSFMGKGWDHGVPGVEFWTEALRVAKPGAHLLAFGGTRTYHRLACAIEDAGWEIRDCVMWVYGSGFPKSLDVSKAIDKAAGAEREVVGQDTKARSTSGKSALPTMGGQTIYESWDITAPATEAAKQWSGWGTALKPAWEPIIVARKPLIGTVAENVLAYGTGGINVDGCRIESGGTHGSARNAGQGAGYEAHNKPGRKYGNGLGGIVSEPHAAGRWPANVIHDGSDEVLAGFPVQSSPATYTRNVVGHSSPAPMNRAAGINDIRQIAEGYGDSGSAARFFYCAKASKADRDEGCEGLAEVKGHSNYGSIQEFSSNPPRRNHHPTVKPTALMRYLCRLVTPPKGIVLDPFCGSGSTGKAAILEGFDFVGIEQDADYAKIAEARIKHAMSKKAEELPL